MGGIRPYSRKLRKVTWPPNFKPTATDKYDGSTNLVEWLNVYQLAIEAAGGDSHVMANYLPICLSASARTWLMGLPASSITSWTDLCRQFISNFRATCDRLGIEWDLAGVVQKEGESLWEYIHRFCNKRNVIPEVEDKSIVMFFKRGLRNKELIRKLAMKSPRSSEEMLEIANKYDLAEEVTLGARDLKKDKPSHQESGTSKSQD